MAMGCKMSRCVPQNTESVSHSHGCIAEAFVLMGPMRELGQANASDNGARVNVVLPLITRYLQISINPVYKRVTYAYLFAL